MENSELAAFKTLILARLSALEEEDRLGEESQETVMLDQQSVGRLSRMDALQQQAMAKATSQRRKSEAQQLSRALDRIEDGTYGECADCGEEIEVKRLELSPAIQRCVDCATG